MDMHLTNSTRRLVTKKIKLKPYFQSLAALLEKDLLSISSLGMTARALDVPEKEIRRLTSVCSPSQFRCSETKQADGLEYYNEDFNPLWKLYNIPEKKTNLKSLNRYKSLSIDEREGLRHCTRYIGQVNVDVLKNLEEEKVKPSDMDAYSDFLLTIRIFCPTHTTSVSRPETTCIKSKVSQELLIPGSFPLTALRDRIVCSQDFQSMDGDVSEDPGQPVKTRFKDVFKSAMLFIDDTFYVDGRHKTNIDYSSVIREWCTAKGYKFYGTLNMESTKFEDLTLRLGYPYLFLHNGFCEHVIIFSDARLLMPTDSLFKDDYPLLASFASVKGKSCCLCSERTAKFIATDCNLIPLDKALLCNVCLVDYLYNGNEKVCDFKLYKYVDRSALL